MWARRRRGRVEGGPKWADTDQWDIEAKLDDADMADWDKLSDKQRMERVRPQLRELLAERFGLELHAEMKVTPVYALVQSKGGVKMTMVAAPPANADPQEQEDRMRDKAPKGPPTGGFMVSDKGWVAHAVQVAGWWDRLATRWARPISRWWMRPGWTATTMTLPSG